MSHKFFIFLLSFFFFISCAEETVRNLENQDAVNGIYPQITWNPNPPTVSKSNEVTVAFFDAQKQPVDINITHVSYYMECCVHVSETSTFEKTPGEIGQWKIKNIAFDMPGTGVLILILQLPTGEKTELKRKVEVK